MAHVAEANALRADFAALLRQLAGEGAVDESCEAPIIAFAQRAQSLQHAFAAARLCAEHESDGSVALLHEDIAALEREIGEKDALLAKHRERLSRWQAECTSIRAEAVNLSVLQV